MTKAAWGDVRKNLRTSVGENNFITWIAPLELAAVDADVATLTAPTNFIANWVNRNFADHILRAMASHGLPTQRIEIDVQARSSSAAERIQRTLTAQDDTARPLRATPAAAQRPEEDIPTATLDARFTFDNFVVGKPNALAHAAARRVAEGGQVTFNPLFLYGGVGLGKTHLMHAIAWELQARQPGARVLYLSAEQFMYRFVQALRDRQIMDFKSLFRSVDILMVDDVQFIAGKESTQEEFFHTFNALVDQGKQIVISADRAPGEIKDLEERIKSRLSSGLVVDLHPTDYELRLGILQQKVELNRTTYGDVDIGAGVLEFLAHRITTNVRVLEGALTRLFALASLVGREVTLDLAQDCLSDILRSSDRKVTVEEIQRKVSEHYNIRLSDMIGPKRLRVIARPRQVAMYLAKQMTTRSLPEIGRRFGGRDHTTIMHGVRKVEELRANDTQLAEDLDLLRRLLES
ncbi:chromosomal replication initiator protein DnaA [Pararhodobacter sp.]|uniref:chromosomal replication initiator protein DnaA n=1 Tax=Pararhodobacter sp. TaxID=2127056 RepID=UPI002AFDEC4B|nr:chromosomal replication initiator protein DnaA [Pararhodobacter sp.]